MEKEAIQCEHACRNTCAMLNQALHEETAMMRFYQHLKEECDYPDVRALVEDLLEKGGVSILKINQKLNEIQARAESINGVMSSYEPRGE
ncbi:MAG: hypothetical protein V1799_12090 [bacterium]